MRILKNLLLLLALVVAAGIGALAIGWQPEPFEPGSVSAARLQPGPLPVQEFETVFEDRSRPTAANGDYAGADSRRLQAIVWYPDAQETAPYPLLVYSHGFSSGREEGDYLAEHLASLGFVVVALEFPLTHMTAPGGPSVRDVVNQPGDVSFVIDQMLSHANTPSHRLAGLVDPGRIGALGLSLGGLTTELVTFHPDMRDPRIGAALSIAGPTYMFTPRFFQQAPPVPFLMLAGDIDAIVPYPENAAPMPMKLPGSELVTLRGASHAGFAGMASSLRWMNNPDALGCLIVERNINADMEDRGWYHLLGSPEQGVRLDLEPQLCRMDPLPEAMNVLRQHMISRVVVTSFFQRAFSTSASEREASELYLRAELARELSDVEYQASEALLSAQY